MIMIYGRKRKGCRRTQMCRLRYWIRLYPIAFGSQTISPVTLT
jgi:hypothetical protein